MMSGPEIAPRDAAMFMRPWTAGLHFRGRISLGTQYAKGTAAKPNPMSVCAAMSLPMVWAPGAMAQPMKEMVQVETKMIFRA